MHGFLSEQKHAIQNNIERKCISHMAQDPLQSISNQSTEFPRTVCKGCNYQKYTNCNGDNSPDFIHDTAVSLFLGLNLFYLFLGFGLGSGGTSRLASRLAAGTVFIF